MAKLRKAAAPSGGGFTPVAFLGTLVPARGRHERQEQTISAQDVPSGALYMRRAAKVRHSAI